jgi:hypothetical protein
MQSVGLGEKERLEFIRDGWLVLRSALSKPLVGALVESVGQVSAWAQTSGAPGLHHFEQTEDGPVVARSEWFADAHPLLGDFVRGPRVLSPLGALFGDDAVLFKEKVNYKHPGGGGFAPHQDATAYRFVDHHISVMVPLDSATVASGCLWFAKGYEGGAMRGDGRGRIHPDVVESLEWVAVEAEPGDMVLFDSYTPHYSETNNTERSRRALYLTYNAASSGDHRATYYADKLATFQREGAAFSGERVRISINDDFLGRVVEPSEGVR